MNLIKALLFGLFVCLSLLISAQQQKVGFNIGYGISEVSDDFKQDVYAKIDGNFFTLGATYSYSPINAAFDLGTGLTFADRNIENMQLYYVRVPVSFDLHFGNVFQPTIGAGVSANFLIASDVDSEVYRSFESSNNEFQVGAFLRGGFIYMLNPRYSLKLRYTYGFDLTYQYTTNRSYGGHGGSSEVGMSGRDQYITIGLDITLSGKSAE